MQIVFMGLEVEDPKLTPTYAHSGDAGMDLRASESGVIYAGERAIVPTGVRISMHPGIVGLVHPRSGLAAKHGITVLNAPGTIDSGYEGEIKVILLNTDDIDFYYEKYDRIAQIVFQEVLTAHFNGQPVSFDTVRSSNGFGSTGVS